VAKTQKTQQSWQTSQLPAHCVRRHTVAAGSTLTDTKLAAYHLRLASAISAAKKAFNLLSTATQHTHLLCGAAVLHPALEQLQRCPHVLRPRISCLRACASCLHPLILAGRPAQGLLQLLGGCLKLQQILHHASKITLLLS
jgi:hypothetical protein